MIPDDLLKQYGAVQRHYAGGVMLFSEGETARHFFQLVKGAVKMVNFGDGKEFIQGLFTDGQSFGEPPFLIGKPYPASALTTAETVLWQCGRPQFFQLLRDHPDVHLQLTQTLSERLLNKARVLEQIAIEAADERLLHYLDHLKARQPPPPGQAFEVPYTRQQLADLMGLRVETVIRALKRLEKSGHVRIVRGKVVR